MMLKLEKYEEDIKEKECLLTTLPWVKYDSLSLDEEETRFVNIMKGNWLYNTSIKVTVPDGYYLKVPHLYGSYFNGSFGDNFENKELSIYTNKPNEIFIPIDTHKIKFEGTDKVYNRYLIDVINNSGTIIYRYIIHIILCYKDNGKSKNRNGTIDVKVSAIEVFRKEITYGMINILFLGYLLWFIITLTCAIIVKKDLFNLIMEPSTVVIFFSYLMYIIIRTKYVGDTWVNRILLNIRRFFKKPTSRYYSMSFIKKEIKKQKELRR